MAIFHLNFSNGKVGKGLAHYKYIMGLDKYSYKENELLFERHNMPSNLVAEEFWLSADAYERKNGRVYKEIRISLPNSFTKEENQKLLNEFIDKEIGNNFYYSAVIHNKDSYTEGIKNIHAHIMLCPRKIDEIERDSKQFFSRFNFKNPDRGGALKDPYWNKKETLIHFRESWEKTLNKALEKKNLKTVSCKSLKTQKEIALENKDFDLADLLNREAIYLNKWTIKKDKKYYNELDIADFENYTHNQKIKDLKFELYNLIQKQKEFEINKKLIFEEMKNINSSLREFNRKEEKINAEFKDIYSIQEDILMLEVERKHSELKILNLNKIVNKTVEEIKELKKLEARILSIDFSLTNFNNQLNKELEELKSGDLFEKKYKELNKRNFAKDYTRFVETQSSISKLQKDTENYKSKLKSIENSVLNILTKGEYAKVFNELKELNDRKERIFENYYSGGQDEKDYRDIENREIELEKTLKEYKNKFSKGKNKNLYIRTKHNLEKKYKKLLEDKSKELDEKIVLSNILEAKLDFKGEHNLISEVIDNLEESILQIDRNIEKLELKKKSLNSFNIEEKIYNKISKNEYSKIIKDFTSNEKEIEKLNWELKNISVFNFSKRNKLEKEIKELEIENSKLAFKYEQIRDSISGDKLIVLKNEYEFKIKNTLVKYDKEIRELKSEKIHISFASNRCKKVLAKRTDRLSPTNFINFHNYCRANLGEVLSNNIRLGSLWSEDELEKQMKKEMDFSI